MFKIIISTFLKLMSLFVFGYRLFYRRNCLQILMYHNIGASTKSRINISISDFERQLRYLKRNYTVISLLDAENIINNAKKLDRNYVVLTFDDGFLDFVTNAFPLLSKYSLPATVFLCGGLIERGVNVNTFQVCEDDKRAMSVDDLIRIGNSPLIDFQAHSYSHDNFDNLLTDEVIRDTELSNSWFNRVFNRNPIYFAFPRGRIGLNSVQLLMRYYKRVFSTSIKRYYGSDFDAVVGRIPIFDSDGRMSFHLKLCGVFDFERRITEFVKKYVQKHCD